MRTRLLLISISMGLDRYSNCRTVNGSQKKETVAENAAIQDLTLLSKSYFKFEGRKLEIMDTLIALRHRTKKSKPRTLLKKRAASCSRTEALSPSPSGLAPSQAEEMMSFKGLAIRSRPVLHRPHSRMAEACRRTSVSEDLKMRSRCAREEELGIKAEVN